MWNELSTIGMYTLLYTLYTFYSVYSLKLPSSYPIYSWMDLAMDLSMVFLQLGLPPRLLWSPIRLVFICRLTG